MTTLNDLFIKETPVEILLYIQDNPDTYITEIGQELKMSRVHVDDKVKKMMANDIVKQTQRSRKNTLVVTEEGHRIASMLREVKNDLSQ